MGDLVFPTPGAFRRWIEKVTRNRLIDLLRRHYQTRVRGKPPVSLDQSNGDGTHLADHVPDSGRSPATLASRREMAEALGAVVATLPPDYRNVLQLTMVESLPIPEIALKIGRSAEATRKLLTRAVDACREAMRRSGLVVE
jgi:RNA polymerase sigma-70 factor (ECF subfamily)